MQREELIARLDTPVKTHMLAVVVPIIEENDLDIDVLFEISFHKQKEIAFRAAWMLEYIMVHQPDKFGSYVPRLLELLPKQKNPSAMRHYAKIVAMLTAQQVNAIYKKIAADIDFESIIEVLFTWLVEPETLVATKVHCMQALANLVPRYAWIKDDLLETVDYLINKESIAFFARAKMVRKQLKK